MVKQQAFIMAGKSKIKALTDSVSSEDSLSVLKIAIFSLRLHMV